ncbi:hypothetical protein DM02DRAFT_509960, partial [Periconia macrospinosa]
PRCCGIRIPFIAIAHFLTPELVNAYKEKEVEVENTNPIYCSNSLCTIFIKPEHVRADTAICPACNTRTCVVCKTPDHGGLCPEDQTTQMLMDVAKENGWQQCYGCKAIVELTEGCNHI